MAGPAILRSHGARLPSASSLHTCRSDANAVCQCLCLQPCSRLPLCPLSRNNFCHSKGALAHMFNINVPICLCIHSFFETTLVRPSGVGSDAGQPCNAGPAVSVFIEVGQSAWARARGRSCFPSRVLWGSAFDWVVSMAPVSWSRAGPLLLQQKRLFLCFLLSTFQCFLRTGAMQLVRAFQSTHSCNPFCHLARSSAQLFLIFLHRLCFPRAPLFAELFGSCAAAVCCP